MLFPCVAQTSFNLPATSRPTAMIVFRTGSSFRIDAQAARHPNVRGRFAQEQGLAQDLAVVVNASDEATLAFRRWWAEHQPEARWANARACGRFVIDVSHGYWRDGGFLLMFDEPSDAQAFALTFLGRDQTECEEAMRAVEDDADMSHRTSTARR